MGMWGIMGKTCSVVVDLELYCASFLISDCKYSILSRSHEFQPHRWQEVGHLVTSVVFLGIMWGCLLCCLLTLANPLALTSLRPAWPRPVLWSAAALRILLHSRRLSLSALALPPQQVQTCVWDVSSPFRIVLVKGSKVNAEESAKVNSTWNALNV